MWPSEITVRQHLMEMHQAAEMRRMAAALRSAHQQPRINRLLSRVLLLFRRPRQTEVVEWSASPRTNLRAVPTCSPSPGRSA